MPFPEKKNLAELEEEAYTFSDEATKNKIKRHINDIQDVITEKDIANAKVPGVDDVESPPTAEELAKKEELDSEINTDKPVTPWDTLSP